MQVVFMFCFVFNLCMITGNSAELSKGRYAAQCKVRQNVLDLMFISFSSLTKIRKTKMMGIK